MGSPWLFNPKLNRRHVGRLHLILQGCLLRLEYNRLPSFFFSPIGKLQTLEPYSATPLGHLGRSLAIAQSIAETGNRKSWPPFRPPIPEKHRFSGGIEVSSLHSLTLCRIENQEDRERISETKPSISSAFFISPHFE